MPYYGTMEMSLHCCELAGMALAVSGGGGAGAARARHRAREGRRRTEDLIYCEDLWLRVFK